MKIQKTECIAFEKITEAIKDRLNKSRHSKNRGKVEWFFGQFTIILTVDGVTYYMLKSANFMKQYECIDTIKLTNVTHKQIIKTVMDFYKRCVKRSLVAFDCYNKNSIVSVKVTATTEKDTYFALAETYYNIDKNNLNTGRQDEFIIKISDDVENARQFEIFLMFVTQDSVSGVTINPFF